MKCRTLWGGVSVALILRFYPKPGSPKPRKLRVHLNSRKPTVSGRLGAKPTDDAVCRRRSSPVFARMAIEPRLAARSGPMMRKAGGWLDLHFLDNDLLFLDNDLVALVWSVLWNNVGASGETSLDLSRRLEAPGEEAGAFFIPLEPSTGSTRFALSVTSAGHENDRPTL